MSRPKQVILAVWPDGHSDEFANKHIASRMLHMSPESIDRLIETGEAYSTNINHLKDNNGLTLDYIDY